MILKIYFNRIEGLFLKALLDQKVSRAVGIFAQNIGADQTAATVNDAPCNTLSTIV
jgi:hypothetical protein